MARPFTGWHMTTILVAFFGVVIAVNLVMAHYAISTFGGTVVDNSYVASQNYNRWLADADRQAKLGWTPKVILDPARRVQVSVSRRGKPLDALIAAGTAIHPLGRMPPIPLTFIASPHGVLVTNQVLPTGRWRVQLSLRRGADTLKLDQPVE